MSLGVSVKGQFQSFGLGFKCYRGVREGTVCIHGNWPILFHVLGSQHSCFYLAANQIY